MNNADLITAMELYVETLNSQHIGKSAAIAILASLERLKSLESAEGKAGEPVAWAKRLDDTDSLHMCSICDDGAEPLYPESALLSEVAKLEAAESELAELKPDALRYRYFKAHLHERHAIDHFVSFNNWHWSDAEKLSDLDAAIDKAMTAAITGEKQ